MGLQIPIGMTTQAIRIGHAQVVEHFADFVGLVAVHASRENVGLLLPQLATDSLAMYAFDLPMAVGAGRRDISPRYGGIGIGGGEDIMRCVTRRTIGCHRKALSQQALAVNTFRVILQDVMFTDVAVPLHGSTLPVTSAAEEGDIQRCYGRTLVLDGQNVVIAVTRDTTWRQGIAAGNRSAVHGARMLRLLLRMAGAALNSGRRVMGHLFTRKVCMAPGAA